MDNQFNNEDDYNNKNQFNVYIKEKIKESQSITLDLVRLQE